jgi:putative multiple sugar transport system substrate-binding protein
VQLAVLSDLNKSTVSSLVDKLLAQKLIHETEANLTTAIAVDKGNVIILAPNDGTARAIADGKQSMTVFKDVRTLVSDAIGTAVTFLEGKTPTSTTTYNNGKIDVPANPSVVVTVDLANVKAALVDSGYFKPAISPA